jgi:regulator of nonsense transcripts 1
MLTVQYRMKPAISALPNKLFYGGRLQDSQERQEATLGQQAKDMVTFLTHRHREENALKGYSICNPGEASIVFQCVQELIRIGWLDGRSEADVLRTTGITTPYKEQAKVLCKLAKEKYGNDCELEIATVDTFQGRDKEFMIISTVRSSPSGSPGHTGDPRRTCVALTRARNRLYIIGNPDTLRKDQWNLWARLLDWYTEVRTSPYGEILIIGKRSDMQI